MAPRCSGFAPTRCVCRWCRRPTRHARTSAPRWCRPESAWPEIMSKKKKGDDERKIVADNRKARHAYFIESTLEAGLMLMGSEVKSLRTGKATIGESYAYAKDGEIFLVNAYIPEYAMASRFNHEPRRSRKVLVHKAEVRRLSAAIQREGMTLIPLRLYFNPKGIAKIE